ncbi:MAG: winged helix DNA-binding domain-containing protein, partial [Actinomycetota bacterium]|nr:winged helix DNA-binding domain-containing protein [Actinomycetota bacterium]
PLTASRLGGAKRGGPWWDWSPIKMAVELLLDRGEVICATRQGWKRVYDLPSRVLSPDLVEGLEPDDAACIAHLITAAGAAMGVATRSDLADYYRLRRDQVAAALPATALVSVRVEGWKADAWADPVALDALGSRGRHRTTLLSPFDSLIWDRARTLRLFGFVHRLEAYTPAPKRVHGYYAMPVLAGGHLVGRVDPGRSGSTLVGKRVSVTRPSALTDVAVALREAATWVGASQVAVDVVDPPELKAPLNALLG